MTLEIGVDHVWNYYQMRGLIVMLTVVSSWSSAG